MHGNLKGRRREDHELVQRATGARLRAAGVEHINDMEDISNAFTCIASEERFRINDEIMREKDISFFNMRATNSMVRITTSEGTIEALPSCGHFTGSAEAPKLFATAHERPITEWFEGTKQLLKELKAVGLDGKERDISLELSRMSFFASWYGMDKMRRRVFAEYWMCQIRRWMRRSRLAVG